MSFVCPTLRDWFRVVTSYAVITENFDQQALTTSFQVKTVSNLTLLFVKMPVCGNCGKNKRNIKANSTSCADCCNLEASASNAAGVGNGHPTEVTNTDAYWDNMNKLLDRKFATFAESFKDTILGEVRQITEPISNEVKALKEENKKLKTDVTLLKAKQKEQGEKLEKMETALKEHQKTLSRNDKDGRSKRLILSGVPEENTEINNNILESDKDKVDEMMKILAKDVRVNNVFRIGKKDQGEEQRPRFLMVEFANATDRNQVKKNSIF